MLNVYQGEAMHPQQTAHGYPVNMHHDTGAQQLQQTECSKEAEDGRTDASGRKQATKAISFPSAARNSTNSDFSIPAFHTQSSQPEAQHSGDQSTSYASHQHDTASIERVDGCRQEARNAFDTPPRVQTPCNVHAQMTPRAMNAAVITPERERLQYLSPFNNDEGVRFAQDWAYRRPLGRPSECSSHVQASDSSSVPDNFHAVCQGHMQQASSSKLLVAEYESDRDLRSLSSIRSVMGELEDLQQPGGSGDQSGEQEHSAISSRDYSESCEYDSHIDSTAGSWQEESDRSHLVAESHAQAHAPQAHPPQWAQPQYQWSHAENAFRLAQSLQASAVYVQQLQEMQHRMQQHMHSNQLEISALRYALAEAHCKIASQGSELVSLRALQHLASNQPLQPAPPAIDSSLGDSSVSATVDSSNPVESINSCVGVPVKAAHAQPEDPVSEPVWNPVFSIEGASQCQYDSSRSSSSPSVPSSAGYSDNSSRSNPGEGDAIADDPKVPDELTDTSDSSDSFAESRVHSAEHTLAAVTPQSMQRKTLKATPPSSPGDVVLSAEPSCASTTVNRAKDAMKAAEATAADHELHLLDLLGTQAVDDHELSDSCEPSEAASSGNDYHYSVDLCANEAASWRGRAQSSVKFQHHPRLLAAIELLHETVRDAQRLYAPRLCDQDANVQPDCGSNTMNYDPNASTAVALYDDTVGDEDEDARLPNIAACAWNAVEKSCWLAGSLVGLASLASDAVESVSGCNAPSAHQKTGCACEDEPNDTIVDKSDCEVDSHEQMGIAAEWQPQELTGEVGGTCATQDDAFGYKQQAACAVPALPLPCALFMMGAEDAAGIEESECTFVNDEHDTLNPCWENSSVEIIEIADSLPVCFDRVPEDAAESLTGDSDCNDATAGLQQTAQEPITDEVVFQLQMPCSPAASCNHEVPHSPTFDTAKSESIHATWSSVEDYFRDIQDSTESGVENEYAGSPDNLMVTPATQLVSVFLWSYCRESWDDHRLQPELAMALQHTTHEAALVIDAPITLQVSTAALQAESCDSLLESPADCTVHIASSLSAIVSSSSIEDEIASEDTSLLLTGADASTTAPRLESGASVEDVFSAHTIISTATKAPTSNAAHHSVHDSQPMLHMVESVTGASVDDKLNNSDINAGQALPQAGVSGSSVADGNVCVPQDEQHPGTLAMDTPEYDNNLQAVPSSTKRIPILKPHITPDEVQLTREPSVAEWGAFQEAPASSLASAANQTAEITGNRLTNGKNNVSSCEHSPACSGTDVILDPVLCQEVAYNHVVVAQDHCEDTQSSVAATNSSLSADVIEDSWYSEADQAENDAALGDALCPPARMIRFVPESAQDVVVNALAYDSFGTEAGASDCEWLCSREGLHARHLFAGRFSTHGGMASSEEDETKFIDTTNKQMSIRYSMSGWFDHAEPDPVDVGLDWDETCLGVLSSTTSAFTSAENKQTEDNTSQGAVMLALVAAGMHSPEKTMHALVAAGMQTPEECTGPSSSTVTVQAQTDVCDLPGRHAVTTGNQQLTAPAVQHLSDHASDTSTVCSKNAVVSSTTASCSPDISGQVAKLVDREAAVPVNPPDLGTTHSDTPRPQVPLYASACYPRHPYPRRQVASAKPASRQVQVSGNGHNLASQSFVPGSRATLAGVAKADFMGFLAHGGQYPKEMAASSRQAAGIPWKSSSFSSAAVPGNPQDGKTANTPKSTDATLAKQHGKQPDLGQASLSGGKEAPVIRPQSVSTTEDGSNGAEAQDATPLQIPAADHSETAVHQQENSTQHTRIPSIQPPSKINSSNQPVELNQQPKVPYPEPLSVRSLVQVEDFSPRSFAPPEEPVLPPASTSTPASVSSTSTHGANTQVCQSTVGVSAADAQRSWTAAQNSINNINKRSRPARPGPSIANLGSKQPVIAFEEAFLASHGSTMKPEGGLSSSRGLLGDRGATQIGDINKNQAHILVEGHSAAHRALLRSLKRHQQEAASNPAQRHCFQKKAGDADKAWQHQKPLESGVHMHLGASSASEVATLKNANCTKSLSTSEIRSNLAIARRALKRMQEKQA